MDIDYQSHPEITVIVLAGRFDAHGAEQLDEKIQADVFESQAVCLDLSDVPYISSAGIRILVRELKRLAQPELLALVNPSAYVRDILGVTGVERLFRVYADRERALAALRERVSEGYRWRHGEEKTTLGTFAYWIGSDSPSALDVIGSRDDVLHARVTPASLARKTFGPKEYAVALGAMGGSAEECAAILGETMTIAGPIVCLPTDGNDTPDFLIPQRNSERVAVHVAFCASFAGAFNEYCTFRSASAKGVTLDDLCAHLFAHAPAGPHGRKRAVMAMAMHANLTEVFCGGLVRSPVAVEAPPNGASIASGEHASQWLEDGGKVRHRDVTALTFGVACDPRAQLPGPDREILDALVPGADAAGKTAPLFLHQHGGLFKPRPAPPEDTALEDAIAETIKAGTFVDMRHLDGATRVSQALIGLAYIDELRRA